MLQTISGHADVLVLGAGIAGLAAAELLHSQGLSVLVLEGRSRIGGRVYSVALGHSIIDLGASWVHGNDAANPIALRSAGFHTVPTSTRENTLYDGTTGQQIPDDVKQRYEQLYEQFEEFLAKQHDCPATSIHATVADARDAFIQQQQQQQQQLTPSQKTGLEFQINTRIEQEYGADAADLSAKWFDADTPFDGEDVLFPLGYSQVVSAVAESLSRSNKILLQHNVQRIHYSKSTGVRVDVITPNMGEKTFTAKYTIVTFPIGVLKKHSGTMFDPPLPAEKAAAISNLGVGLLNKVILLYDEAFWAGTAWLNRLPAAADWGRWQELFNVAKYMPDVPALVAFNAGPPAWEAEGDSDEGLVENLTDILAAMYPAAANIAKSPKEVLVTRWGSDPFSLGSYSCMVKGSSPADMAALAAPVDGVLFFAGEARSSGNQGTVHGAYSTGQAAAAAVLEQFKAAGSLLSTA